MWKSWEEFALKSRFTVSCLWRRRTIFSVVLCLLLASCGFTNDNLGTFAGDARYNAHLAPQPVAQLPVYNVGDSFVFASGVYLVTETVLKVTPSRITWVGHRGREWTSSRHPHLLPVKVYDLERNYAPGAYSLFPLKDDNYSRFIVKKRVSGEKPKQIVQTCEVVGTETVEVRAGKFWTFKIFCRRDGFFETFNYSPSLGHYVIRQRQRLLRFMRAELVSYSKAPPLKLAEKKPTPTKKQEIAEKPAAKSLKPDAVETKSDAVKTANLSEAEKMKRREISAFFDYQPAKKPVTTDPSYPSPPHPKKFGVQIGAFSSFDAALTAYNSVILPAAPEIFSQLGVNYWYYKIPKTGQTVVRVIVGEYQNRRTANRICGKIKKRKLDCWVNSYN